MTTPIIKTAQVPLSQVEAYELFVERLGSWWPLGSRSVTAHRDGCRPLGLHVDAKTSGEIAELAVDGSRYVWGSFTDCHKPHSVEIAFHLGQSPDEASHLVVSFLAMGEDACRVKLYHAGWENFGQLAGAMREGYEAAWGEIFDGAFVEAATKK